MRHKLMQCRTAKKTGVPPQLKPTSQETVEYYEVVGFDIFNSKKKLVVPERGNF
jgi:hypothetical protein